MKVSGFTFLRNGQMLGYPFVESICSILPIVDEFVVALGPCDDQTEPMLREIGDPKIRIIPTRWNERLQNDYSVKGYVYAQQKSIALWNCTGDWAFYLEADEVVHEDDLPKIRSAMEKHLHNDRVEALAFDFLHFYGNKNTYAWSPRWYRSEARVLRNTIPAWASESLFFNVLVNHHRSRYPRAAHTGAHIYHYGWMRSETQMRLKSRAIAGYGHGKRLEPRYDQVDPLSLRPFKGTHPRIIQGWLPPAEGLFPTDPHHRLTRREKKHRLMLKLEDWLGISFSKKHYQRVA